MKKQLLSCLFFLVCSTQSVYAGLVRVSYTATIGFDPSATVGSSVRFALDDDANYHTEGSVPYSLFSDSNGDYAAGQFPLGSRVVEAIPYSEVGGTGTAGTSLLVTFTVVGDDGTTPPPPPPSDPTEEFSCLQTNTGAITALTGLQNSTRWFYDLPLNARLDLRNASFESITPDQDNWHPLQVRGGTSDNVCVAGGTIVGVRPLDISWRYTYANSQNHAAFRFENQGVRVHGVHVYNTWDGIRPATNGSNNWEIAHSWLEYIRDDCVENDQLQSGRVYDSFFDGCYVGYSNRPGSSSSGNTGAGKTVVFEKSLFRLEPMPYPQDEQSKDLLYVDGVPFGHNGFFKKFSRVNPRFVVKDSIFLYQWSPRPQAVSLTGIDECSNNTVVWLGPGDFPGDLTPGCFTVTTDINVWIDAVRDWHARHPNVGKDRKKPVDQQGNIWSYFPRFGQ